MKEERYDYLNDEELEALIAEVERNGMIAPPIYLKELIMKEAEPGEMPLEKGWKTEHTDGAFLQGRKSDDSIRKAGKGDIGQAAKRQFRIYSFKIAAAAAAAVISLIAVPMDFPMEGTAKDNHIERQIEKDIERYQEAKREALEEEEGKGGGPGGRFGAGIWNGLTNWLGMEE